MVAHQVTSADRTTLASTLNAAQQYTHAVTSRHLTTTTYQRRCYSEQTLDALNSTSRHFHSLLDQHLQPTNPHMQAIRSVAVELTQLLALLNNPESIQPDYRQMEALQNLTKLHKFVGQLEQAQQIYDCILQMQPATLFQSPIRTAVQLTRQVSQTIQPTNPTPSNNRATHWIKRPFDQELKAHAHEVQFTDTPSLPLTSSDLQSLRPDIPEESRTGQNVRNNRKRQNRLDALLASQQQTHTEPPPYRHRYEQRHLPTPQPIDQPNPKPWGPSLLSAEPSSATQTFPRPPTTSSGPPQPTPTFPRPPTPSAGSPQPPPTFPRPPTPSAGPPQPTPTFPRLPTPNPTFPRPPPQRVIAPLQPPPTPTPLKDKGKPPPVPRPPPSEGFQQVPPAHSRFRPASHTPASNVDHLPRLEGIPRDKPEVPCVRHQHPIISTPNDLIPNPINNRFQDMQGRCVLPYVGAQLSSKYQIQTSNIDDSLLPHLLPNTPQTQHILPSINFPFPSLTTPYDTAPILIFNPAAYTPTPTNITSRVTSYFNSLFHNLHHAYPQAWEAPTGSYCHLLTTIITFYTRIDQTYEAINQPNRINILYDIRQALFAVLKVISPYTAPFFARPAVPTTPDSLTALYNAIYRRIPGYDQTIPGIQPYFFSYDEHQHYPGYIPILRNILTQIPIRSAPWNLKLHDILLPHDITSTNASWQHTIFDLPEINEANPADPIKQLIFRCHYTDEIHKMTHQDRNPIQFPPPYFRPEYKPTRGRSPSPAISRSTKRPPSTSSSYMREAPPITRPYVPHQHTTPAPSTQPRPPYQQTRQTSPDTHVTPSTNTGTRPRREQSAPADTPPQSASETGTSLATAPTPAIPVPAVSAEFVSPVLDNTYPRTPYGAFGSSPSEQPDTHTPHPLTSAFGGLTSSMLTNTPLPSADQDDMDSVHSQPLTINTGAPTLCTQEPPHGTESRSPSLEVSLDTADEPEEPLPPLGPLPVVQLSVTSADTTNIQMAPQPSASSSAN